MSQISKQAQAFIKQDEECRLDAYQDAGGIWTIGWGHVGPDVHEGMKIDQLIADTIFLRDLGEKEKGVENLLVHPATQGQFDSLVSFAYNVGVEALRESALLKKFNAGDIAGAAREFGEWVHVGQGIMMGLVRRRVAEIVMFLTP